MESVLVTGTDSNNGGDSNSPPSRYTEVFEKVFPFYLSIGMTYDQFWNQDNTIVKYYREADRIRTENLNTQLWMQGIYIYKVLEAFAPILVTFPKKNAKIGDYLSQPMPLTETEQKSREEQEAEAQSDIGLEKMFAWMKTVNEKRKSEKSEHLGGDISGRNC